MLMDFSTVAILFKKNFNFDLGSKYFENERKKEEQVTKRIEEQKQKLKAITQEHLDTAQTEVRLVIGEDCL